VLSMVCLLMCPVQNAVLDVSHNAEGYWLAERHFPEDCASQTLARTIQTAQDVLVQSTLHSFRVLS